MSEAETTLGGSRGAFPETVWQTALDSPDATDSRHRVALERFLTPYWRPVYSFLRKARRCSIEDAKDLTQEFFRYLLEGDLLTKYRREKGRFRSFLKGVLRNFTSQARRDGNALKRGGGETILSLDAGGWNDARLVPEQEELTPERLFDRQWATEVIQESVAELRRVLPAEGRAECLQVYEAYELAADGQARPTYGELAAALRINEHQIKNHIDAARARLEQIVRERLTGGVSSPEELAQEMKELFSA